MRIIEIVKKLYPFDYSVAGEGNELAIRKFKNFLNFKIHSFSTSKYLNGWKIPVAQKVNNATIYSGKNKILDKKIQFFIQFLRLFHLRVNCQGRIWQKNSLIQSYVQMQYLIIGQACTDQIKKLGVLVLKKNFMIKFDLVKKDIQLM